ncbi:MAG: GDP-mannose 4,6-dehydratase, partial [Bacillus sp. (in: Bacteria)]|nr:GDP-mannose 4,6-dehydratase [Bacillus sp. (in: firmicutes)]
SGTPNNLLPFISQVAIGELKELSVFGDSYPTKDGTGVRDYIHVVDLAWGHLKALERMSKTTGLETYNLGTGKGYSVLEIIEAFQKASGVEVAFKIIEPRPGDVATCYADPTKAKIELGWVAEKRIEEMCEDAWRWQVKNPNGYDNENSPLLDIPRLINNERGIFI